MTTEQSIFNADQAQPATQVAQQEPPKSFVIPTEAQDLIGDGKKYNSAEAALKSIPHAQTHIKTLEDENRALKEEIQRRKSAEQVLDELRASPPQLHSQEKPSGYEVDPTALESIVTNVLEKKTQQTQALSNAQVVTSRFTEMYGEKAEEMYNKVAKENGLSVYQLNQMALTSPTVVLNLAGFRNNTHSVGKTTSDVIPQQNNQSNQYETKVKAGATTKELMGAFAAARAKVEANIQKENK